MKRTIRSLSALMLFAAAASACAPSVPTGPVPPVGSQPPAPSQPSTEPSAPAGQQPGGEEPAGGAVKTATLRGKVFDEQGAEVKEGEVIVRSLKEGQAFEAKASIIQGSYVINGVPAGVLLEITARRDGFTQRSRVETLLGDRSDTAIDFGGQNGHFISDYPEIMAIAPTRDAVIEPGKLSYELTLSEPLDETNRRRLENALRLLPANDAANGGAPGTTTDLAAQEDAGFPYDLLIDGNAAVAPYAIKKGSMFMQDADKRAKVLWSEDFRKATLEFDAPMIQDNDQEAAYQVVLVSEGTRITDASGKQLGTDASGSLSSYPGAGRLILSAFKAKDLSLSTIPGLAANSHQARWAATHNNMGAFKLKEDKVAPRLEGIQAAHVGNDTRIELMFSEPMAAFNGTASGLVSTELGDDATDLANYTFALGKTAGELEGVKLDGTVEVADVDPTALASYGAAGERGKEFRFAAGAFAASRTGAPVGSVVAEVDPLNAKRVLLTIVGRPNFFQAENTQIKGRVANLADPAGNAISGASADADVQIGTL